MIERPAIVASAASLIQTTTDDARRSKVLDALGRYRTAPTADHYDALFDAIHGDGKPPVVGSLAAARDARIAA